MQASASTPEEDFNGAVQCTQYQLDDEMEEEDVQDTQNGPQLILVGTSGQPEMTNFSLPAPQIASLYVIYVTRPTDRIAIKIIRPNSSFGSPEGSLSSDCALIDLKLGVGPLFDQFEGSDVRSLKESWEGNVKGIMMVLDRVM